MVFLSNVFVIIDLEISRVSTTEFKLVNKKMRSKKRNVCEIDFTNFLDKELLHIFAPPKNRRSIMLPAEHDPCRIVLPEDCHYIPDNLVRLFILPSLVVGVVTSVSYIQCF